MRNNTINFFKSLYNDRGTEYDKAEDKLYILYFSNRIGYVTDEYGKMYLYKDWTLVATLEEGLGGTIVIYDSRGKELGYCDFDGYNSLGFHTKDGKYTPTKSVIDNLLGI